MCVCAVSDCVCVALLGSQGSGAQSSARTRVAGLWWGRLPAGSGPLVLPPLALEAWSTASVFIVIHRHTHARTNTHAHTRTQTHSKIA